MGSKVIILLLIGIIVAVLGIEAAHYGHLSTDTLVNATPFCSSFHPYDRIGFSDCWFRQIALSQHDDHVFKWMTGSSVIGGVIFLVILAGYTPSERPTHQAGGNVE